jgi:hypothetical protein
MFSGRRESVVRHIMNPRIHGGHGRVISYTEYVAGIQMGIYRPVDSFYRQRNRGANGTLLGRLCEPDSYLDKLLREIEVKQIERHADVIVNAHAIFSKRISMANSTEVPNVSRFSFTRDDIFGISGYICSTCFTIKPAVLLYSSFSNMEERSPIIKFIDSCHTCTSQMTNKERNHYLKYNLVNGIAPLLFNWIRLFWPEDQKMKLVAVRVNELEIESPGDCPATLPPNS